jgi:hypothetical protein
MSYITQLDSNTQYGELWDFVMYFSVPQHKQINTDMLMIANNIPN